MLIADDIIVRWFESSRWWSCKSIAAPTVVLGHRLWKFAVLA